MTKGPPISGGHYSLIRVLLGGFLYVHFVQLLPYGAELFSAAGALPAAYSPLLGIIPNPLRIADSPAMVNALLWLGAGSGILIAAGYRDRIAAAVAATILAWLYARNPLIANPSLPVVGWLLVAHLFVPSKPYGAISARGDAAAWNRWEMPQGIWLTAWIMLAVTYSYSGYTKLLSPSWVDGSAIRLVLQNPLARDHLLRTTLLDLPDMVLQLLTWTVMWVEVFFAPLCLWRPTRKIVWSVMLAIQFGFLVFLNFADLTFPMLLIHAFTFDQRWLNDKRRPNRATLFFDGYCAFCNRIVRFALAEDADRRVVVAPLDGELWEEPRIDRPADDSIVVIDDEGAVYHKSKAVIYLLRTIGGIWTLAGNTLALVPSRLRDAAYDLVGRMRYRLGSRLATSCQMLPRDYADQLHV